MVLRKVLDLDEFMEASLPRRCSGPPVTLQSPHELRSPAGTRGCLPPPRQRQAPRQARRRRPRTAPTPGASHRARSIFVCHTPTPPGRTAPLRAASPGEQARAVSPRARPPRTLSGHKAGRAARAPSLPSPAGALRHHTSLALSSENGAPARSSPPRGAPPAGPPAPRGPAPPWPPRGRRRASPCPRPAADGPARGRPPPSFPAAAAAAARGPRAPPRAAPRAGSPRLARTVVTRQRHLAATSRSRAPRGASQPPSTVAPPSPRQPLRHHRGCGTLGRGQAQGRARAGITISITPAPPEEYCRRDSRAS